MDSNITLDSIKIAPAIAIQLLNRQIEEANRMILNGDVDLDEKKYWSLTTNGCLEKIFDRGCNLSLNISKNLKQKKEYFTLNSFKIEINEVKKYISILKNVIDKEINYAINSSTQNKKRVIDNQKKLDLNIKNATNYHIDIRNLILEINDNSDFINSYCVVNFKNYKTEYDVFTDLEIDFDIHHNLFYLINEVNYKIDKLKNMLLYNKKRIDKNLFKLLSKYYQLVNIKYFFKDSGVSHYFHSNFIKNSLQNSSERAQYFKKIELYFSTII